jgi:mevalonate kinase
MSDFDETKTICTTSEMIKKLKNRNKYLTEDMLEQTEKLKKNINILHKELEQVKEENRKLNFLIENYRITNK